MKRLLVGLLCGLLAISTFAGCGSTKAPKETKEDTTEYKEFEWPKSDIAQLIPQPKSNIGHIEWEGSDGFCMYVSEMTQDDYAEYVNSCWDAGFTVDYSKGDDYFYSHNADGYKLDLNYEGDNVIFIRLDAPQEDENVDLSSEPEENTDVQEPTDSTDTLDQNVTDDVSSVETSSAPSSGVRPEVKDFLDSYESFMNEYADFMTKYSESNDVTSMLKDYSSYMKKYEDFSKKYDELGDDDLNSDELQYYIDVQTRVNQKLLNVAN